MKDEERGSIEIARGQSFGSGDVKYHSKVLRVSLMEMEIFWVQSSM